MTFPTIGTLRVNCAAARGAAAGNVEEDDEEYGDFGVPAEECSAAEEDDDVHGNDGDDGDDDVGK